MKLVLPILLAFNFCAMPFTSSAQLNSSLEIEIAPTFTNRLMTAGSAESSEWQIGEYQAQSKILPGFYAQIGVNFREDKSTRFFVGAKAVYQQITISYYDVYAMYSDPNGNWNVDGFCRSRQSSMTFLLFPISIKQNMISKSRFRLVTELGIAPGFVFGDLSPYGGSSRRAAVFADFSLGFEWKLKNGNCIGFKFPAFSYSLLSNNTIHGDIRQHNYSLGLGLKFGFDQIGSNE